MREGKLGQRTQALQSLAQGIFSLKGITRSQQHQHLHLFHLASSTLPIWKGIYHRTFEHPSHDSQPLHPQRHRTSPPRATVWFFSFFFGPRDTRSRRPKVISSPCMFYYHTQLYFPLVSPWQGFHKSDPPRPFGGACALPAR